MSSSCLVNSAKVSAEFDQQLQVIAKISAITENSFAVTLLDQATGCGRCHLPGGCGGSNKTSFLNLLQINERQFTIAEAPQPLQIGEMVTISIEQKVLHRAVFTVYVLPLLLMIIGALIGDFFGNVMAVFGCAVGLLLALAYSLIFKESLNSKINVSKI